MKFGQDRERLMLATDDRLSGEKHGTASILGMNALLVPLALKSGVDLHAQGDILQAYTLAGMATALGTSAVHYAASIVDIRHEQASRQSTRYMLD